MPLNMRDPGSSSPNQPAHTYPYARGFALVVVAALVVLFLMHHLVFSATVSGGVK